MQFSSEVPWIPRSFQFCRERQGIASLKCNVWLIKMQPADLTECLPSTILRCAASSSELEFALQQTYLLGSPLLITHPVLFLIEGAMQCSNKAARSRSECARTNQPCTSAAWSVRYGEFEKTRAARNFSNARRPARRSARSSAISRLPA